MTLWAVRRLIVSADRWYDVQQWARARFGDGTEILPVRTPYHPDLKPDVELRWVGSDAGARPNRRLEVVDHRTP